MSKVSPKELWKKIRRSEGASLVLVDFLGLKEIPVVFSTCEGVSAPQIIYLTPEARECVDKNLDHIRIVDDIELFGLAEIFCKYPEKLVVVETSFLGVKCMSIWHFYPDHKLRKVKYDPLYILWNKDLVKISNIKQQFKLAA